VAGLEPATSHFVDGRSYSIELHGGKLSKSKGKRQISKIKRAALYFFIKAAWLSASTFCLLPFALCLLIFKLWSEWQESNLRELAPKASGRPLPDTQKIQSQW
jgi:hypothetical protein